MTGAPAKDAETALASGPLIMELFSQAKRLLALQPRMENRRLRKDNIRHQHCRPELFSPPRSEPSKALDLLLPLSMDDIRTGSMPIHRHMPHVKKAPAAAGHTPLLMDGSPRDTNCARDPHDDLWLGGARVKTEPCDGMLGVTVLAQDGRVAPTCRSNLTSSLRQSSEMETESGRGMELDSGRGMELDSGRGMELDSGRGIEPDAGPAAFKTATAIPVKPTKPTECFNCHTLKTPLWRKDRDGNTLCNACGLFLKLHGTTRPLSLKTDVIRKRSSRRASVVPNRAPTTPLGLSPAPATTEPRLSVSGSIPIRTAVRPLASSATNSYGSMPYHSAAASVVEGTTPRSKNVLILPKPLGLAAGSMTSAPSAPSSPYGALQFKRKKSEVALADEGFPGIRRTPSLLSTSAAASTPVMKRGFLAAPGSRRASKVNLSRVPSCVGTPPASLQNNFQNGGQHGSLPTSSFHNGSYQSNSFNQNGGYGGLHTTSGQNSLQNGFQNGSYNSYNNMRLAATPNASYFDLSFEPPVAFDPSGPADDALNYSQSPSSVSADPVRGSRSSFVVPSDLAAPISGSSLAGRTSDLINPGNTNFLHSAFAVSAKTSDECDADADDFFKNYTSLHNDTDATTPAATPVENSVTSFTGAALESSNMGDRYEIKPNTATKSSLTDGLKGRAPIINAYNDSNDTGDLDWLKFEI